MSAHPLEDARLAVSLLTAVPDRAARVSGGGGVPQVAGWFPAVGLALGAVGYGLAKAAEFALWQPMPLLVAAVMVSLWALLTRMLHFAGLAAVADGLWGPRERTRPLDVSGGSVGAFGVTAVVLTAIVEVAAITAILDAPHQLPVLLVPVLARFSATAGCWFGTAGEPDGLGRWVVGAPTVLGACPALVVLAAVTATAWIGYGVAGVVLCALGIVVAMGVPHLLAGRFGGVNAGVLAASVLITETAVFVLFAIGA